MLVHNSVTILGLCYESPTVDQRSWLYLPEADIPFYRATNLSKCSANNVRHTQSDRFCSRMTEIARSPWRPLDLDGLPERVDQSVQSIGLVPRNAPIATLHVEHLTNGYPVPTLGARCHAACDPGLADGAGDLRARPVRRLAVRAWPRRRDGTYPLGFLLAEWAANDVRRLLVNEVNSGHGRSIRRAMGASRGEWIFHLDSDGQVDVGKFRLLRDQQSKADLVVGMRLRRHDPLHRLILTRLTRATVSVLARQRVRDANVPFNLLIHRSRFEHLCPSIPPAAFAPLILIVFGAHRSIRFSSALIKPYEGIGARRG